MQLASVAQYAHRLSITLRRKRLAAACAAAERPGGILAAMRAAAREVQRIVLLSQTLPFLG